MTQYSEPPATAAATSPSLSALPGSVWDFTDAATTRTAWNRVRDYVELTKPRIAVMVLLTVSVGYWLGQASSAGSAALWSAWLGIALVAAGSSAVNQWLERQTDARMRRTMARPLPSGRLQPWEVLSFGLICAVAGSTYLAWQVNATTAWLTVCTFVLYTAVYTPLKRYTSVCTAIGAIPGALPPVLGWTAAGQPLDTAAGTLFALLFVWQFPHFMAIAWLYRDEYYEAGLRMLPGGRPAAPVTGLLSLVYALVMIPVSTLPAMVGLASRHYALGAAILSVFYAVAAAQFAWNESRETARRLVFASLLYLPLLLLLLAADHWRLLQQSWLR
jgi:heme o synthase